MFHEQGGFEHEPAVTETDIAIVGMAGRFPGAPDIDAYWRNLREGVESVVSFTDAELLAAGVSARTIADPDYVKAGAPLGDMEMFDAALFGLTPREAAIMDPQHRHFLECAWEALENAGHSVERFAGPIGVFGGSGHNAYLARNLLTNPDLVRSAGFFLLRHTGNDKDFLTTRASYLLNLKGPSVAVQTACSTSLVAIHLAVQSLLAQECDMALAGGVTIEMPHRHGYMYEAGEILSPDGHCRPFDQSSQGTVFGSGAGIVVLRRLADAINSGDHIYGVIKGTAVNNDGSGKIGYLAPSVDGQANVILEALTIAGTPAETVSYVEAHGTGTPVGDPIEIAALSQAFRRGTAKVGFCAVGSVKGNIGHTDTAAGVAGLIKVALSLHHGELPPSLNFQAANEACAFDHGPFYVNSTLTPWIPPSGGPRRAGISSLGVGGTNAHLIVEEAPPRRASSPSQGPYLLALSAATETAVEAAMVALGEHVAANPGIDLGDVEYTLQVGRRSLAHRRSVVVQDEADAGAVLRGDAPERVFSCAAQSGERSIAFMFPGGGAQHPNMGLDLYRSEPVFRDAIDACLAILDQQCGIDIRGVLYPPAGTDTALAMERPSIGLPALFATQYAQAQLWQAWGIVPKGMIGHSMGEYVAAHLAGVFSLADALRLVHRRGQLFETLPVGAMLSVPMPAEELEPLIAPELSIAATNAVRSTVVSGPCDAIAALRLQLEARELPTSLLRISVAAHSAMLEPILGPFEAFLESVSFSPPTQPFVSSLTGTWITAAQAQDPAYWVRHLRQPVRFDVGVGVLLKDDSRDLLEIGPGRALTSLARQHPDRLKGQSAFNSSRHPDDRVSDRAHMLGVLGQLWSVGAPVLFGFRHGDGRRRNRIPLPTYRFDHQRYWIEPGRGAQEADEPLPDPLAKRANIADWFHKPVWRRTDAIDASDSDATVLLFADECGIADQMAQARQDQGADVIVVRAGRRFAQRGRGSFTIDPAAPDDYVRLIATLASEARVPRYIYHLWSVTGMALPGEPLRLAERAQTLGFYSLLHLAQAIGHEDIGAPIDLVVVSDGVQRVCGELDMTPAKATVLGPCRVIPQEFANIRARSIDIALPVYGSPRERELVEALLAEPDAPDLAETVAWRSGERWVQEFAPVVAPQVRAGAVLRANGTYIVTGGLGEIGLALAAHIAETAGVRIVLLARGALPPREEWLSLLAGADADGLACQRIRQILAIEKLGAEVLIIAADVTDPVGMRRAIRRVRAQYGAIHGVFHTAGVLDDEVLQLKTVAAAGATLAPKVRGTLVLQAALAGERPDFVMLFSSISATLGAAGQVDYAAANAFLDAFAQSSVAGDRGNVIAVDWGPWREIGMAAALARAAGSGRGREVAEAPVAAIHPLIDRCIRDRPDDRLYATRFGTNRHWLLDEHRTIGGGALIPGTGFLEIARAALAARPEANVVEFEDVLFLEPFCVCDGEERELLTHLKHKPDGSWAFSLTSMAEDGSDDPQATTHVRGVMRHVVPGEPERLPVPAILARCTAERSVVPSSHMRFGPRWNNIARIHYGENEALIQLAMPPAGAEDSAMFVLHPALFDMATAGAQIAAGGVGAEEAFFVPASYGRIRLHRPLTHRLFSHVRKHRDPVEQNVAVYDVTIADEHGLVLAEVREFTMIRLRETALLARTGIASAAPPAARSGVADAAPGILPKEGMAVIDRILAGGLGAQIVVSPQNFGALLETVRATTMSFVGARSGRPGAGTNEAAGTAPMTPGEQMIAGLWQEMLGIDTIGPADNFFDLGGHSLLAVQFVNKLRKRSGVSFPATILIEAPTVAALAALIEPAEFVAGAPDGAVPAAAARASTGGFSGTEAIRIGAGKQGTPVFLIHDGLGEILLYRTLALALDPSRPVYGLQPEARADGSIVHAEIGAMAAAHIAKIRRVQPSGPYLLAGLCAGGVLAVEIACQLESAGEEVLYVGIIDAADVEARERPFFVARLRLKRFARVLAPGAGEPDRSGNVIGEMAGKIGNFVAYEAKRRLERARAQRNVRELRARASRGEETAPAAPVVAAGPPPMAYLDVYKVAHREHRPRGTLNAPVVVLYRATQGTGAPDDMPFFEQFSDCALGWGQRVMNGLQIVPVPGGHVSVLQEPHVRVLARAMQDGIDAALASLEDRSHAIDRARRTPAHATPPSVAELILS